MTNKTTRAIIAFAVAPLAPACLCAAYVLCFAAGQVSSVRDLLAGAAWLAGFFTYPATLVVGLPAYLLINRSQRLRRQHVLVISGATGAAIGLVFGLLPLGAVLGLSAGVTFWLIWYRYQDEWRPF